MDCVLVFRIGSLGDSVVATPALRCIRERFPGAHIVLLTNAPIDGGVKAAGSYQVWAGSGLIDSYLRYPIGGLRLADVRRLAGEIRRHRATTAVYLMPRRSFVQRLRDLMFFRLAGISKVIGLKLLAHPNDYPPIPGSDRFESEARRLLRSIDEGDRDLKQEDFSIGIDDAERCFAASVLRHARIGVPYLVLSVGTKSLVNDWGQAHWRELVELLDARLAGVALVTIGAASESARCDELLDLWHGPSANFCGLLEPRQSAAVLEGAALYVGHDSGPMHLASAVGIPVVSIFSARELPGVWFPVGNEANVFYNSPACRGCRLDVCTDKAAICIQSIEAAPVADRVLALLRQGRGAVARAQAGGPKLVAKSFS